MRYCATHIDDGSDRGLGRHERAHPPPKPQFASITRSNQKLVGRFATNTVMPFPTHSDDGLPPLHTAILELFGCRSDVPLHCYGLRVVVLIILLYTLSENCVIHTITTLLCAALSLRSGTQHSHSESVCTCYIVRPLRIRSPTHQSFRLFGELYSFSYCSGCRCTLARQSDFRSRHSPLTSWSPTNRLVPYVLLQCSSPAVYLDFRRCAHHILLRLLPRCWSCSSPAVAVAVCYEPWYVTYLPGFSWSLPIFYRNI